MEQDLRYPIGKFVVPTVFDQATFDSLFASLASAPEKLAQAVKGLTEDQLDTPYRPEGWTVRQVVHHLADSHMNAYIRFHCALTEDSPMIKAYDEKAWAELSYQHNVPISTSIALLENLHQRWVGLLKSMEQSELEKTYVHPVGNKTYVLKNVVAMYAWHGNHHIAHITALKERMGW